VLLSKELTDTTLGQAIRWHVANEDVLMNERLHILADYVVANPQDARVLWLTEHHLLEGELGGLSTAEVLYNFEDNPSEFLGDLCVAAAADALKQITDCQELSRSAEEQAEEFGLLPEHAALALADVSTYEATKLYGDKEQIELLIGVAF
jgi:hypothetical protein